MNAVRAAPAASAAHAVEPALRPARASTAVSRGVPWPSREAIPIFRCACGGSCPRCAVQGKPPVNGPGDPLEQGEDRVAAETPNISEPSHRVSKAVRCSRSLSVPPMESHDRTEFEDILEVVASPSEPMPVPIRQRMESRFGYRFDGVRVHADAKAASSAAAINAHAYTLGTHIVFGAGRYTPYSRYGERLLAHELAHVLQQGARGIPPAVSAVSIGARDDPLEREADALADAALQGSARGVPARADEARVQRQETGETGPRDADAGPPGGESTGAGDAGPEAADAGPEPAPAEAEVTPAPCDPQPLSRAQYVAHPGTSTNDFGLTVLSGNVSVPAVTTRRARGGFVLEHTDAAMPALDSVYTQAGTFTEGQAHFIGNAGADCPSGRYELRWTITPQGAARIRDGELEHCADLQHAFTTSLRRYADIVNRLAAGRRVFVSHRAAVRAVTRQAGAAPDDWAAVFRCLARKTEDRDLMQWHNPRDRRIPPSHRNSCAYARAIVHGSSFPHIGQHGTADLIRDCGENGGPVPAPSRRRRMRVGKCAVGMPVPAAVHAWPPTAIGAVWLQRRNGGAGSGGSTTTTTAPPASAAATDPCAEAITETRDQALDWLGEAYNQLLRFDVEETFAQLGAAPDPEQERVRRTLARSFHTGDLDYVSVIRRRVLHMASTLRGNELTVTCAVSGDPHCRASGSGFTAAYVARPYAMVLCSLGSPGNRPIQTFVHELAHAVVPQVGVSSTRADLRRGVRDRAYDHERLFRHMSVEEALDNAESYGLLVEQLATRTDVEVATSPVDTTTGCTDPVAPVTAIARFEQWNRDVRRWLVALIHFITSPTPPQAFADLPQNERDKLARYFPAIADVAGLRDLLAFYDRMAHALSVDVNVVCASAGGTCSSGVLAYSPEGAVTEAAVTLRNRRLRESMHACPDWFGAGDDARIGALYAVFILSRPDWMISAISLADVYQYVHLARDIGREVTPAPAASRAYEHLRATP